MSDIKETLKAIGGSFRQAQNLMFSGKFDEAYEILDRLDPEIAGATEIDAENYQVKNFANQAAKLRKDMDKRTGRVTQGGPLSSQSLPPKPEALPASASQALPPKPTVRPASSSQTLPPKPAAAGGASSALQASAPAAPAGKLPGGVSKRIKDIHEFLRRNKIDAMRSSLEEIENMYSGQFDESHPDYVEARLVVECALTEAEAATAAAGAASAAEEASQDERRQINQHWRARFQALSAFGHDTGNDSDLMEQKSDYEAARPVVEEFVASDSFDMEYDVEQVSREFVEMVEGFPTHFETTKRKFLDACLEHIRSRSDQLDRMVEDKPATISDKNLESMTEFFDGYAKAFEEGGPEWTAIGEAMERLREKNAGNRRERAKLITVRPDVYAGEDAASIRAWSEDLVKTRPGQIEILKTVVFKDDWEEKSQWEDCAGDRRFVTRREIFAQVAAREGDQTLLHSIAVSKELRADNTWSSLKGNIMWSEEMLAENLG